MNGKIITRLENVFATNFVELWYETANFLNHRSMDSTQIQSTFHSLPGRVFDLSIKHGEPLVEIQPVIRKYRKHNFEFPFQFRPNKLFTQYSIETLVSTPTQRRILMRKILKDKLFLAHCHKRVDPNPDKRLNYPLCGLSETHHENRG